MGLGADGRFVRRNTMPPIGDRFAFLVGREVGSNESGLERDLASTPQEPTIAAPTFKLRSRLGVPTLKFLGEFLGQRLPIVEGRGRYPRESVFQECDP